MSVFDLPAVHYKHLARDEIRIRRAQKKYRPCQILGLFIPLDGPEFLLCIHQLLGQAAEYRFGQGQPRSDNIDGDAVVTYFHRK